MAISVAWNTGVISVPKADMPIVQASPEIRQLDVDQLRLDLRTLEAGGDTDKLGVPRPKTHNHVTETTVSGDVFARFVIFLAPYTLEFEDGQYTVKCVGANHNIADRRVANQVSLIIGNSFGLIKSQGVDVANVQAGLDAQGYTSTRADKLDDIGTGGGTDGGLVPSGS